MDRFMGALHIQIVNLQNRFDIEEKRNNMMKTTKTYLFDFDGTLVDSMPTYISLMLGILDDSGVSYGDDIIKIITPLGLRGTAEYFRTLGVTLTVEDMVARMGAEALDAYSNRIPAKATVPETLRKLKEGGASLNVLTASPHQTLDPCLKRLGLWELFDHVWSCEDFSTTKADPNIYVMAAKELGCAVEDVVFIDDNFNAVNTAKQAGMQAWGIYDDSSADMVEVMKAHFDRYLMTLSELLEN